MPLDFEGGKQAVGAAMRRVSPTAVSLSTKRTQYMFKNSLRSSIMNM